MHPFRIILAGGSSEYGADLRSLLEGAGHQVIFEAEDEEAAIQKSRELQPDAVFLDIAPPVNGVSVSQQLSAEHLAAQILIIDAAAPDILDQLAESGAAGSAVFPFVEAQVLSTLQLAVAHHRERGKFQTEIENLEEKLTTRKLVERAKSVLMEAHGLNEADAFRRMQTQSMNSRQSLKEVAQAVMASYVEQRRP